MMRRLSWTLPALLLASACASPAPEFFGAARQEVRLNGIDFVVLHKGDRAEVVRLGYLSRPERAGVQSLMVKAAEGATGCTVRPGSFVTALPGDTGEARMDLDCRGA
ncbi:MAG: hypothetical protein RLZZ528_2549 [Pseudomonadota bacterium]|jgi:hypothetical protein